jgi:hypothetical protein
MKRQMWFLGGAILGLLVPLVMAGFQHYGWCRVHPSAFYLFRPGVFIVWPFTYFDLFRTTKTGEVALGLLILLANALIFGLLSAVLRRVFPLLIGLLLLAIWVQLPPSDKKLREQFVRHQTVFGELVQKSDSAPRLLRIGPRKIEAGESETEKVPDGRSALTQQQWEEYRKLFRATGMNEGLRRDSEGAVFLYAHTLFGKAGPFGTYFGYVHCPMLKGKTSGGFLPCTSRWDSMDRLSYRYEKVDENWYICEIFEVRSLED